MVTKTNLYKTVSVRFEHHRRVRLRDVGIPQYNILGIVPIVEPSENFKPSANQYIDFEDASRRNDYRL